MNGNSRVTIGVPAPSGAYPLALIVLGVLFVAMTGWYVYTLITDPTIEVWGFFVSNFIFLLGVTQFGVAFTAIMRICGVKWARPYYRIAELATIAFSPLAGLGLVFILAKASPVLFFWYHGHHDPHPSAWLGDPVLVYWRNALVQLAFYLVAIAYSLAGLVPDVEESDCQSGPGWRRGVYRWLLGLKERFGAERLKRAAYFYSPIVLVVAVIAQSMLAIDFAMTLADHYHSSVFPLHFIVGNMQSGAVALLFLGLLLTRLMGQGRFFGVDQVHHIAIVVTGFTLLWLYMFWAQFFVSWFGNLEQEYGIISRYMFGHYRTLFWVMMSCVFFIPLLCLIFLRFKNSWTAMLGLALVINFGNWLHRYLIVVPVLEVEEHAPFTNAPEVAITLGLLCGFLFFLLLLVSVIPTVSNWEVEEAGEWELEASGAQS